MSPQDKSHAPLPASPLDDKSAASAKSARELLALIGDLEQATEGTRELDARIWEIHDPKMFQISQRDAIAFSPQGSTEAQQAEARASRAKRMAPKFTTSLDAALSLTPKGMMFSVDGDPDGGSATILKQGGCCWEMVGNLTRAATPALALCIAALKARSA